MILDDYKQHKAQINPALLWEYDINDFDWDYMKDVVVQRVIERGWKNDYYFAINKYGGLKKFKNIIKTLPYLDDVDINFVSKAFNLNKNELCSYKNRQLA